jgi:small-conductance mechanosensitive channel
MKKLIVLILFLLLPVILFAQPEEADVEDIQTESVEEAEETEIPEDIESEDIEEETGEPEHPLIERFDEEMHVAFKVAIAVGIVLLQWFLIWLVWRLFKKWNIKVDQTSGDKIKPFTIKNLKILTAKQITDMIHGLLKLCKYIVTAVMLLLTILVLFGLFPQTRDLAFTLLGYILTPIKNIAIGTVKYIPNLFTIIIIIFITRYVLKLLRFFADRIAKGRLVIPGFYPDWAYPTYKIFQVLLWAFTVAIIYPYLPGSDSRAFQGVSVFVGIVFSLGSTTAIGNLVAGLVITYMRPFKIGDRVQIKDITGFVVEKNLMVVRLKTHKNEYVTFPNLTILGDKIINYNTSTDEDEEGLILHVEITAGYDTPWEKVHEILTEAALATEHIQKKPKPFVLQTKLDDFYACYQLNCYTKDVSNVPRIYTLLYENIQNGFRQAGVDMTTPHHEISIVKK